MADFMCSQSTRIWQNMTLRSCNWTLLQTLVRLVCWTDLRHQYHLPSSHDKGMSGVQMLFFGHPISLHIFEIWGWVKWFEISTFPQILDFRNRSLIPNYTSRSRNTRPAKGRGEGNLEANFARSNLYMLKSWERKWWRLYLTEVGLDQRRVNMCEGVHPTTSYWSIPLLKFGCLGRGRIQARAPTLYRSNINMPRPYTRIIHNRGGRPVYSVYPAASNHQTSTPHSLFSAEDPLDTMNTTKVWVTNTGLCALPLLAIDGLPEIMEGVDPRSFCLTPCCIPCPPQSIPCPLLATLIELRNPLPPVRDLV
jgi:hypothetical protein